MIGNCVRRCLSLSKASRMCSTGAKELQLQALNEKCFLVTPEDKIIGTASKKECHLVQKDGNIPLHRAFSVFLFNTQGQLLLQKRTPEKITYPSHFTNSCCSHPIADVPGEDEEENNMGILRAAQRRLNYELGISVDQIPIQNFNYLTRIHYKDPGNGLWGEHEIDYVLFLQVDVKMAPNPSEISQISFVPRDSIDEHVKVLEPLTPWFRLIYQTRLKLWWDNLDNLEKFKDHENILKL